MNGWRHPTVLAVAPALDDASAWARLGVALLDAVDVGYRAVRLRADGYDHRVASLLDPLARRGVHTQLTLDPRATLCAVDTTTYSGNEVGSWLVAAPNDGATQSVVCAVGDAIEGLSRQGKRRGIAVELTKSRTRDLDAIAAIAVDSGCSHLILGSDVSQPHEVADELERSMAYVTARRASREFVSLDIELDLFEREQLARAVGHSLCTTAAVPRLVPTLVISAGGRVDPMRAGIAGFSLGRLDDAPLLQLLARWRKTHAARWVALCRAAMWHVGRLDAWPVVDWPAALVACARLHGAHSDADLAAAAE